MCSHFLYITLLNKILNNLTKCGLVIYRQELPILQCFAKSPNTSGKIILFMLLLQAYAKDLPMTVRVYF